MSSAWFGRQMEQKLSLVVVMANSGSLTRHFTLHKDGFFTGVKFKFGCFWVYIHGGERVYICPPSGDFTGLVKPGFENRYALCP